MRWYFGVWKKYATFKGRAPRKEYWMFVLFNILVSLGISLSAGIGFVLVSMHSESGDRLTDNAQAFALLANFVYSFAVLIPSIAVAVRRMHDSGRSGWWIFFPLINLIFLCLDSQAGENRYGANPKKGELLRTVAQLA